MKKSMKVFVAAALALVMVLALVGCTKTETPASESPASETPVQEDKMFNVVLTAPFTGLSSRPYFVSTFV